MKKIPGIKGLLIRKATVVPSKLGLCEVCKGSGRVRYFVAAKLPRILNLCDKNYLRIRDRLEKSLIDILKEEGLHG